MTLSFTEIACLVRLHDELTALDRLEDAEILRGILEGASRAAGAPDGESKEARKRRLAADRQQRARDRHAASRTKRDGVTRDDERDDSVTQRDAFADTEAAETPELTTEPALSAAAPLSARHATQRDGQRDESVMRHVASRSGGVRGGAVGSNTLLTTTTTEEEIRENPARESRSERDDRRDEERDVTRDASHALVRTTTDRPLALISRRGLIDHPALATTNARLGRLSNSTRENETRLRLGAELVFQYWCARLGKGERALLSPEREKKIIAQLRMNNCNVSELCYAIDGLRRSKYHMGNNDQGRKYDDVTVVFRDRSQVEKFAGDCPGYRDGEEHPFVRDAREEMTAASAQEALTGPIEEVAHA